MSAGTLAAAASPAASCDGVMSALSEQIDPRLPLIHEAATRDVSFGRAARMLGPADFELCMRRPALHRSGCFALHFCWIEMAREGLTDREPAWRLGLVVPKRHEASAVARNTIKRRWRDAFRRGRDAWSREFGSADLVVRLQSPLIPSTKIVGKGRPKPVRSPAVPARVRARERFDPAAALEGLVDRLRSRGGRPAVIVVPPPRVPKAATSRVERS